MLAATSCSDFSDYNTVPETVGGGVTGADKTLWENITANPDLSDFASIVKEVGFDKELQTAHTYTVWAPVNGSFNMDSLRTQGSDKMLKEFVKNHVAEFNHTESNISGSVVCRLNKERYRCQDEGGLEFDGKVVERNPESPLYHSHPSSNGNLYAINGPAQFHYNGYEYMSEIESTATEFFKYMKRYETRTLDVANSIKGPIDENGNQTYSDSVIIVRNSLLRNILKALVDSEDSTYTVLIPNNNAWKEAYQSRMSYNNFVDMKSVDMMWQDLNDASVSGKGQSLAADKGAKKVTFTPAPEDADMESIKAYWTDVLGVETLPSDQKVYWVDSVVKLNIVNQLFYNNNVHYNYKLTNGQAMTLADSLYTTTGGKRSNAAEIFAATKNPVTLSNGQALELDTYPFLTWETGAGEITARDVARAFATKTNSQKVCVYETNYYPLAKVQNMFGKEFWAPDANKPNQSQLTYYKGVHATNSGAPELDFYLPNVRSAEYAVYVVVVPSKIDILSDPNAIIEPKPNHLTFSLNYTDVDGKTKELKNFGGQTFDTNPEKVDTLALGTFTFPVSYAGLDAAPNLKIMSDVSTFSNSNKKLYEQDLRIAAVILRPVEYDEYLKSKSNSDANKEN